METADNFTEKFTVIAHYAEERVEWNAPTMESAICYARDLFIPSLSARKHQVAKLAPEMPPMFMEVLLTHTQRIAYGTPSPGGSPTGGIVIP